MKKLTCFLAVLIVSISYSAVCNAQNGVVTVFAGNGSFSSSGDGGPADSASVQYPTGIAFDKVGNLYIADELGYVVRKVSPNGVISTFAGNGTVGYLGDGGPATAAEIDPEGVAADSFGNIYIADYGNKVVRKVDTSGIITTIAGNGTSGYLGDGGPATAAELTETEYVTTDKFGNVYISDVGNYVVRKVNTSGIISTVAGTGAYGYTGDGGPATAATLGEPQGLVVDVTGNLYIVDGNSVIRKVNTSGVISTFAGTGVSGFSGDGGPATAAEMDYVEGIAINATGDIYFNDCGNKRIRKINSAGIISTVLGNGITGCGGFNGPALNVSGDPWAIAFDHAQNMYYCDLVCYLVGKEEVLPDIAADSFSVYINKLCNGLYFSVVVNSSAPLSIQTYYGDGTSDINALSATGGGAEAVSVEHTYPASGTYTLKMVLLDGSARVDSATYSYSYLLCNTFSVNFYYDANGDCVKDSTDPFIYYPITTEVDSNGIAVDTISTTSGFDYTAYGNPGDVYSFKILSGPTGMVPFCPSSGTINDTLQDEMFNTNTKYIGYSCTSVTSYDLEINTGLITGRHTASGTIIVNNNYCTPENPVVTMDFSPQYVFGSSTPAPSSVVGNTVTWDLSTLTAYESPQNIQFTLNVPTPDITSTWLTPGDTLHFNFNVAPTTGDVNPVNNYCIVVNTVTGSWDPNEMAVTPSGYIYSGTQLQYTIQFENTGNDTAFNISVYDTLSDYVDVQSLRMIAASAVMNTIPFKYNGHNIVKFDFPNINLLDSAYHNQCNGMLTFNINTLSGLPNGTSIFNHAGIFFDDNAVVMTDTVEDIIGIPTGIAAVNNASKVIIYPNPANDQLTISIDNATYSSASITNVFGQQLLSQAINSAQTLVNVKALPAGMYYITLRGDSGVQVLKFEKL